MSEGPRIRQSTTGAAGVFPFFFSLFDSISLLSLAFLFSPSLFPSLLHAKTHQSGEDQSGTRQRPTWRRRDRSDSRGKKKPEGALKTERRREVFFRAEEREKKKSRKKLVSGLSNAARPMRGSAASAAAAPPLSFLSSLSLSLKPLTLPRSLEPKPPSASPIPFACNNFCLDYKPGR